MTETLASPDPASPLLCELHAHTTWSDGKLSIREVCDLYGRYGFDVLCITDHVNRSDDPLLTPHERRLWGVHEDTHLEYLSEIDAEASRARQLYGLLLLAGLELSYNHADPLLAAHAVAVGLREFVSVDHGIAEAMSAAREANAAILAAHPYAPGTGPAHPRTTQYLAANWCQLNPLIDRWELYNRTDRFDWVDEARLRMVASGDFHRPEHFWGWKTVLPCAKDERAIVDCLRADGPVYLARLDRPDARSVAA